MRLIYRLEEEPAVPLGERGGRGWQRRAWSLLEWEPYGVTGREAHTLMKERGRSPTHPSRRSATLR